MRRAALLLAGAATAAAATAAPYTLDPTHTLVAFEVDGGLSTTRGRFDRQRGSVEFDRAGHSGRVEISVATASLDTGVPALDRLLQGPGLLDTARFPDARFIGDRFVFDGDQVASVAGTLTLAGRSQPLALRALRFNCYTSPLFLREVCGGEFEATLRRSDWGLAEGLPATVGDAVRLRIAVEAIHP